jgi:hypothetical protein
LVAEEAHFTLELSRSRGYTMAGHDQATAAPETARDLSGAAGDIRAAWTLSKSAEQLEEALAGRGISLAAVSPEEARASERTAAFAKEVGNFAPVLKEGEIVAVTERGQVYRLDERTTGEERPDVEARFPGLDRAALLTVTDTKEVMHEAARAAWRDARRDEQEQARPASSIEAAIAEALIDTMTGTELAAALDKAGITIARADAQDVAALEALRGDERLDQDIAWLNLETHRPRHFAELLPGDFAAVTRQGDVYQLSPQKLDLEDIAHRLADVEPRMPSVIEARAQAEIIREETAELWAQRRAEGLQNYADFIADRDDTRDRRASEHEVAQGAADLADATEATLDQGERGLGQGLASFAKTVERILGGIFSLFGADEVKLTPLQTELASRANEELAEARAFARAAAEKEAALQWLLAEQRRQQQEEERQAESRGRLDRGRELEREL